VAVAVVAGAASEPPGTEQRVVRRAAGKEGPSAHWEGPRSWQVEVSGTGTRTWLGRGRPVEWHRGASARVVLHPSPRSRPELSRRFMGCL
jgi:hypothetical protein